ncbi:MAG: carbohydrate kinase [Chitinophagaceae bacterium]|nr:carbohydrate kinase [Chitinophagaceae bacterium]
MIDFDKIFDSFSSLKIGVIGDVMLDTYLFGKVERISPEAPVPVVTVDNREYRIGGAGNVALNAKSLGAEVAVISVTGDDNDGLLMCSLLEAEKIKTDYIVRASERITTNKIRVMSRNQQMMRLDNEITSDIDSINEQLLLTKAREYIANEKPHVIIFEDYNKGVLTDFIITEVIALCRQAGIISAVDPKRKNFFSYSGADIFKPNLKEVKEALNLLVDEVSLLPLQRIHKELSNLLHHRFSFITLSEKGVFIQEGSSGKIIPSHVRSIADVSGAGDTVIATASLVYAITKDMKLAAEVANIAGGLVCEEVGTVAINKEKLLKECESLLAL